MGVKSVRFTSDEEQVLELLTKTYHSDVSTVIKKALWELYEDLRDHEVIEEFERYAAETKPVFKSIDDLLS